MNFDFIQKSIGETTCLVMDLDAHLAIDSFAMNMMSHNHIVNIVPVQIVQMDEKKYAQFDITGLVKLDNRLAAVRPKKEVLSIFSSILNAFEEADAYMLNTEQLFLQWEYTYLDEQGNCMLLYLPFAYHSERDRIDFLREVVSRIKPDYQEKDPYLYDISNAFGRGAVRKLSDFRELIKKCANGTTDGTWEDKEPQNPVSRGSALPQANGAESVQRVQEVKQQVPEKGQSIVVNTTDHKPDKKTAVSPKIPVINIPGREPGAKMTVPEPASNKKKGIFKKKGEGSILSGISRKQKPDKIQVPGTENGIENPSYENHSPVRKHIDARSEEMYESYEATVFMGDSVGAEEDNEGTVLLREAEYAGQVQARLVHRQSGNTYWIREDRAMIGSGDTAHIQIDNHTVSRSHAVIMRMENQYYLEDNHSKNGSFVENRRLQPGRKEAIYDGMMLRFANEEFTFYET